MNTTDIIKRNELVTAMSTIVKYMNNNQAAWEFPELDTEDTAQAVDDTEYLNEIWEMFTDIISKYGDDGWFTE